MVRLVKRLGRYYVVQFDESDFPSFAAHTWHIGSGGYLQATGRKVGGVRSPSMLFHRLIMGLTPGEKLVVDHINHNKLDNRRRNLRVVTQAENMQNQQGHRDAGHRQVGVFFDAYYGRWKAERMEFGKRTSVTCASEDEAIRIAKEMRRAV